MIRPPPAFLLALAGEPIERVEAFRSGRAVYLRAILASGRRNWALVRGGSGELVCFRLEEGGPKAVDPAFSGLTPQQRSAADRFVRRFAWLDGAFGAAPSAREGRIRDLARQLSTHRPGAAPPHFEPGSDAFERGLEIYLDVLAGRWDRVVDALEQSPSLPPFAATLLEALGGSIDALRARAREPVEAGLFSVLVAHVFRLAGFKDAAIDAFDAALDEPAYAAIYLDVARLCRERGRSEDAIAFSRRVLLGRGADDRTLLRGCFELVRNGALDDAYLALVARVGRQPYDVAVGLALAELLLRAGRRQEAEPFIERALAAERSATALITHGAWLVLGGRLSEASAVFEEAKAEAPASSEVQTWLAETALRMGDHAAAARRLADARALAQTAVHTLIGGGLRRPDEISTRTELCRLLEVLGEPLAPWLEDPTAAAVSVLDTFGGSRGDDPSRIVATAGRGDALGAALIELPPADSVLSSRDAAAYTLELIATVPPEELARRFEALAERYPESPHPLCYWGELDLWLGDYDQAIERFRTALSRSEARWGYVGQAAAFIMQGAYDEAEAVLAHCAREFAPVRGATTHVYVGEAHRRRQRWDEAIVELEEALAVKPGRAGAWMNLALAHRGKGEHERAREIFTEVQARWPILIAHAAHAAGMQESWPADAERMEEIYESALRMMRGNRSSHTITYFDATGVFRVARDAIEFRTSLASVGRLLGRGLMSRLAAGRFDGAEEQDEE